LRICKGGLFEAVISDKRKLEESKSGILRQPTYRREKNIEQDHQREHLDADELMVFISNFFKQEVLRDLFTMQEHDNYGDSANPEIARCMPTSFP
jgi:hypothetical protein